ncbi:hypothetical protein COE79_20610 [Bacillus toyonensis]|uniref:hypothetical protein n=1 Tax=Bacillus toyonensis TaxID=155322 RepID=UPI000BFBBAE7|nr:hypothetical protein [Bacillus toyonensis]PHA98695.1 hypothetical protein COE79_20610 [Bacillus toyonensis]
MRMYRWRATLTAGGEHERLKKIKERNRKRKLHRNFTIECQESSTVWIGWMCSEWFAERADKRRERHKLKRAASKS